MKKFSGIVLSAVMMLQMSTTILAQAQEMERLCGRSRVETSKLVSERVSSSTYVFVDAYQFSDALSAYNIVKRFGAKLILVKSYRDIVNLDIKGKTAYVVGGKLLNGNFEKELNKRFASVIKLNGSSRYNTNELTLKASGYKDVGLASGEKYADALAATPYLSKNNLGLALTKPTEQYQEHHKNLKIKVTFGGSGSVKYGYGSRIFGSNRYNTAKEINKSINPHTVAIVDGENFPDALSALNFISANERNFGIMLTNGSVYDKENSAIIENADKVYIVGGIKSPISSDSSERFIDKEEPINPIYEKEKATLSESTTKINDSSVRPYESGVVTID